MSASSLAFLNEEVQVLLANKDFSNPKLRSNLKSAKVPHRSFSLPSSVIPLSRPSRMNTYRKPVLCLPFSSIFRIELAIHACLKKQP